jgi:hypothetical protein
MECLVKDRKDAVTINGVSKYCYEHYQIYDSLQKLFKEVFQTDGSLSWKDYLTQILDVNNKAPWKNSLIDSGSGRTLETVARVSEAELNDMIQK